MIPLTTHPGIINVGFNYYWLCNRYLLLVNVTAAQVQSVRSFRLTFSVLAHAQNGYII